MSRRETALILGATGGAGGELARALHARGWRIRALSRTPERARASAPSDWTWLQGDALAAVDVDAAAEGATLIAHAVNPPGYQDWEKLALPMLDNTIAAARRSGARILLPGTIYNYAPDAPSPLGEDAPQAPITRKGRIRVEMERRLRAGSEQGAPALILRAGDYFGPRPGNNWFSQAMVKPDRPVTAITAPGAPGVGHQWAYLPDVAEIMARLVERAPELPPFARFHMAGHWDPDGRAMIDAIRRAVGRPDLPARRLPWTLLRLASPFSPFLRELGEIRYLWRRPIRLANDRLEAFIGPEPRTPLDVAVAATLRGLGCLAPATGGAATVETARIGSRLG